MMHVSEEIIYDAQLDKWELEFDEDGENDTLVFDTLERAIQEQQTLRADGAVCLPRVEEPQLAREGMAGTTAAIFTPLDPSRRVRLWFKRKDVTVLSGDLDVRSIGEKARVRIGRTVYDVYGCACDLPGCHCDAYLRPVTEPGGNGSGRMTIRFSKRDRQIIRRALTDTDLPGTQRDVDALEAAIQRAFCEQLEFEAYYLAALQAEEVP